MADGSEQEEKRGGARLEMSDTRKGSYVGWLIGLSKDLAPGLYHTGRIIKALCEAGVAIGDACMTVAKKVTPSAGGES